MSEILQVQQLSVELQQKNILSDVNFSLYSGEILGLVGPSGCGKTTLLNAIAGFVSFTEGQLSIDGVTISTSQFVAAEKRNVGVIFQDYALFPHLTVRQNIAFGISKLAKQEQQQCINELLTLLTLTEQEQQYPHQLSGGQQQRVAIARALAVRPSILLLDEPFSNIDTRLRNSLMIELRALLKSLNISAIFVTHNKDEVFSFADKIALIHQGSIIQYGTPRAVFDQPKSWHVADFLQIGSWLPITYNSNKVYSALGEITGIDKAGISEQQQVILVKPHNLILTSATPNCVVKHVSFTEQGYHYTLSSIEQSASLSFEGLSFYSETLLTIAQEIAVKLVPHDYQLFLKPDQ